MQKDRTLACDTENSGNNAVRTEDGTRALKFFTAREAAEAFSAGYLDEDRCRAWVLRQLHPDGARCPDCGAAVEGASSRNFYAGRRCRCKQCGRKFSAASGTFLQGSQLNFRQVFLMSVLIDLQAEGLSINDIAGVLGVSADTVRIWIKKFRVFKKG